MRSLLIRLLIPSYFSLNSHRHTEAAFGDGPVQSQGSDAGCDRHSWVSDFLHPPLPDPCHPTFFNHPNDLPGGLF